MRKLCFGFYQHVNFVEDCFILLPIEVDSNLCQTFRMELFTKRISRLRSTLLRLKAPFEALYGVQNTTLVAGTSLSLLTQKISNTSAFRICPNFSKAFDQNDHSSGISNYILMSTFRRFSNMRFFVIDSLCHFSNVYVFVIAVPLISVLPHFFYLRKNDLNKLIFAHLNINSIRN